MDSPMDADASASAHDSCVENAAAQQVAAAGIAAFELDADDRRREIASRLERYRARRKPRPPRYPSLRLPFDSSDKWMPVSGSALARSAEIPAELGSQNSREQNAPQLVESRTRIIEEEELFANVIEFPRSAALPVYQPNELAEPIFERPRIVEAPEILPPPPALGGMMLEASRTGEADRKTGADLALPLASLPRRIWAGFLDAAILIAALAGFAAIFGWINPDRPPIHIMATAVSIVAVVSWAAYHFLFMVYTGSTPGLRLARLQLVRFDGSMTKRRVRRWRVLASYVSALSLGLGYLWSILDEDGLCWHDRITHTHLT
ncbi:MAG TPA: RDD family protein [Terriglobales bacterium]|nr:RDD family protein [Terriglobales bacterium]